jgi:O-antigen ligase
MLWSLSTRFLTNAILFILLCIVSVIAISISRIPLFKKYSSVITALSNGRTFIWEQGLNLFSKRPVFGYGAYGVLIKVFWSAWSDNKLGFNYAHSTLLQLLLDGGIALAVIFFVTIILYIRSEDRSLKNTDVKYFSHILLLAFFTIGIFESITEYYYLFMFLPILPYLYKLDETNSKTIKSASLENYR